MSAALASGKAGAQRAERRVQHRRVERDQEDRDAGDPEHGPWRCGRGGMARPRAAAAASVAMVMGGSRCGDRCGIRRSAAGSSACAADRPCLTSRVRSSASTSSSPASSPSSARATMSSGLVFGPSMRAHEVGVDEGHVQRQHLRLLRREFVAQRVGQRPGGRLAGRVGRELRRRSSSDTIDSTLSSAPPPLAFEHRREGLAHAQHAEEVGLELAARDFFAVGARGSRRAGRCRRC